MLVEHVMASPVIVVEPTASLGEAARIMIEHRVSGLPVIDASGRLVGLLSEGDLLHRAELGTARRDAPWLSWLVDPGSRAQSYVEANTRRVDEAMTRTVHTIEHDCWLEDAVHLMEQHGVKRLPVVRGGRVVGMLTRADLVRALAMVLARGPDEAGVTDAQLAAELEAELSAQDWVPSDLKVTVRNGAVTLRGRVNDVRQRTALRVAAEGVTGVRRVRDELTVADPLAGMLASGRSGGGATR